MPDGTCGLCGRVGVMHGAAQNDAGETVLLCHDQHMSCYHRWTVYGERPDRPPIDPEERLVRLLEHIALRSYGPADTDHALPHTTAKVVPDAVDV